MGDQEIATDIVAFGWRRPKPGGTRPYWLDWPPRDARTRVLVWRTSVRVRRMPKGRLEASADYVDYTPEPQLFRKFAEVEPSEAGVLAFATQFGVLGPATVFTIDSLSRGRYLSANLSGNDLPGDPLELWATEIAAMRKAIEWWKVFQRNHDAYEDRLKLQHLLNERLAKHTVPEVLYLKEQFVFRIFPKHLLGALWAQLARALEGDVQYQKCGYRNCGNWIEISRDSQHGHTQRARFCKPTHRVAENRANRRDAAHLARQGRKDVQIAQRLAAPLARVRGWLRKAKQVEQKGEREHKNVKAGDRRARTRRRPNPATRLSRAAQAVANSLTAPGRAQKANEVK
jgi:hypothetical protein